MAGVGYNYSIDHGCRSDRNTMSLLDYQGHSPTAAELVARAVALQPVLTAHAGAGELHRRLPDDVVTALTEAGFFRLLTPRRFGGYETELRTFLAVTEALGEADGSAAWLVGVSAVGAWLTAHACPQAQEEVFGTDPNARVAGSWHDVTGRRVDGGVIVSGRWGYTSGVLHATWANISAAVVDHDAQHAVQYMCLVPAEELGVDDTWQVVGMRATGSNTWVADEVFVPEHRLIPMSGLGEHIYNSTLPGLYRLPLMPVAMLGLMGPVLGLADAALSVVVGAASSKAMHHTVFARQSDSVGVHLQVGEAALALRTARLHAYHITETLDRCALEAILPTYEQRAQMRAAFGYAAHQALNAINIAINIHGAAAFAETSPLQRYWRDANIAVRHAGFNLAVGYEVLGKSLLGIEERISPTV